MKAYWFRIVDTDYIGLVAANNWKELFWAIDEHVNPYRVEIACLSISASFIAKKSKRAKSGFTEFRLTDSFDLTLKWKKPKWVTDKGFFTYECLRSNNV